MYSSQRKGARRGAQTASRGRTVSESSNKREREQDPESDEEAARRYRSDSNLSALVRGFSGSRTSSSPPLKRPTTSVNDIRSEQAGAPTSLPRSAAISGYDFFANSSSSSGEESRSGSPNAVIDPTAYLAALDQRTASQTVSPLGGARVTPYQGPLPKPRDAKTSWTVSGNNSECVLAAFRTAKPGINDSELVSTMTSTEGGIAQVARVYDMRPIDPSQLAVELQKGKRAFINAPSLGGAAGRYHAYTAIGVDPATGKIIAWDTDNDHADLKLVPIELIWLAYV